MIDRNRLNEAVTANESAWQAAWLPIPMGFFLIVMASFRAKSLVGDSWFHGIQRVVSEVFFWSFTALSIAILLGCLAIFFKTISGLIAAGKYTERMTLIIGSTMQQFVGIALWLLVIAGNLWLYVKGETFEIFF